MRDDPGRPASRGRGQGALGPSVSDRAQPGVEERQTSSRVLRCRRGSATALCHAGIVARGWSDASGAEPGGWTGVGRALSASRPTRQAPGGVTWAPTTCIRYGPGARAGPRAERPRPDGRRLLEREVRRSRREVVLSGTRASANAPSHQPKTWSPGRCCVTFAPTASTSPATSLPGTGLFGLRRPIARRTRNGPPRTLCQPECLQESGPAVEVSRHRDCIPRRHSPWKPRTSRMPAPTASRSSPVRPALAQSSAQLDDRPNAGVRRCASPWEPIRFTRVLLVVDSAFGAIERIGHPAGQRPARDRDAWTWSTDKKGEMHA